MMTRTVNTQSQHDQIVALAASFLSRSGFREVRADLPGFAQPDQIHWKETRNGHIPDVTALKAEGCLCVFEIETADSLAQQHSFDQWALFAAFADQNSGEFWVVVPKGLAGVAEQRLRSLRLLSAKVWEV